MPSLTTLREQMIKNQLVARGIRDQAVLDAVRQVPREAFVADDLVEFAYEDAPLPIVEEQTLPQPYVVALLVEALGLKPGERVLEVGTGSGYTAAVLAHMAGEVYTIESHSGLAHAAQKRLQELGYDNVHVRQGEGKLGWPEYAPYQAILVGYLIT